MTKEQFNKILDDIGATDSVKDRWCDPSLYINYFSLTGDSSSYMDSFQQNMYYDSVNGLLYFRNTLGKPVVANGQPVDDYNVMMERLGESYYLKLAPRGIKNDFGVFHEVIALSSISLLRTK